MTERAIEHVGVIGLGKMGGELARHLAAAGFKARGYDVRIEAIEAARTHGVAPAESPAALASASDLVIVGVGFDSELEAALFGDRGAMTAPRPGSVIAVASTVAPATMLKIAGRIEGSGIDVLDIPMARGEQAAIDGNLLIFGGRRPTDLRSMQARVCDLFRRDPLPRPGRRRPGGKAGQQPGPLGMHLANHEGFKLAEALGVEAAPCAPPCSNRAPTTGRWRPAPPPAPCPGPKRT